jgi:hypothetical protein
MAIMKEKKAREILTAARLDGPTIDALLEVFARVGHHHDAEEIDTGEGETLDEALEALSDGQEDAPDFEEEEEELER